jgi:hypothetical protein
VADKENEEHSETSSDTSSGPAEPRYSKSASAQKPKAYMLRRHLSEPSDSHQWLKNGSWPSLTYWTSPLTNAMKMVIEARGRQGLVRGLNVMSLCAGALAEGWVASALGLPLVDFVACDIDAAARAFVKEFHGPRVSHLYGSMQCMKQRAMAGDCTIHGRYCVVKTSAETSAVDLLIGGPPCPPYSGFRHNRGLVPPEEHKDYFTIFGDSSGNTGYLQVVEFYRPRGGERCENEPSLFFKLLGCLLGSASA